MRRRGLTLALTTLIATGLLGDAAAKRRRAGAAESHRRFASTVPTLERPAKGPAGAPSAKQLTPGKEATLRNELSPEAMSARMYRPRLVTRPEDTGLGRCDIRVAVCGRNLAGFELRSVGTSVGQAVARRGWALTFGGGNGIPEEAATGAFAMGAKTVGFSPAGSYDEHCKAGRPTQCITTLYLTSAGSGPGIIEREAPFIQQSNIRVIINGNLGTLGEATASIHEPGVLALLTGTGGIADGFLGHVLPHLGRLPAGVAIVQDRDYEQLLHKAERALDRLPEAKRLPPSLVAPGGKRTVLVGPERFRDRYAFLVHENGMSPEDLQKLAVLGRLFARRAQEPIALMAARNDGASKVLKQVVARNGGRLVQVSGLTPRDKRAGRGTTRFTGMGPGLGEFVTQRQVVNGSKVVFVAGGDYRTLDGVLSALHQPGTTVAVLETMGGVSGKLRSDILAVADKTPRARVVYSDEPSELWRLAHAPAVVPPSAAGTPVVAQGPGPALQKGAVAR